MTFLPIPKTGLKGLARRSFLLSGCAIVARAASAAPSMPPTDRIAFRLIRHGTEIGRHTVTFSQDGDLLTARVEVEALVTLLSVPIVRYRHTSTEVWRGNSLLTLQSDSDKNGQKEWVRGQRTEAGLAITGSRTKPYIAPEPNAITSYWNKSNIQQPMISMEDGVLLRPAVARRGDEAIPLASGATIAATHYALSGPFEVDLWYDQNDQWAGMAVPVDDGSVVHYARL